MTDAAPEASDFNTKIIDEFRANEGRIGGPLAGTPMILVHHIGAKSGTVRVTPLACNPQPDGRLGQEQELRQQAAEERPDSRARAEADPADGRRGLDDRDDDHQREQGKRDEQRRPQRCEHREMSRRRGCLRPYQPEKPGGVITRKRLGARQ